MSRFIIIAIFLLLLVAYVACHTWAVAPLPRWGKGLLVALGIVFFSLEFVTFTPLMDRLPLNAASMVYNIGNKTIIILFYLLMAFLLLDLGRLLHIVPRALLHDNGYTFAVLVLLMSGIFIYASIHYTHKVRVPLTVDAKGKLEKPLTVVMASDLHVGYHNRRADLSRWVDMINSENPDVILIAGDIIDMSYRPVEEEGMAAEFRRLKAPVYACLGNHEYYSGEPHAERFYREAGIHLLIDSTACYKGLAIIGRDDRTNPKRKALKDLVADSALFTILLDHQPYHLEDAEAAGIDFQLSGHTHRGQVWPLSWITDALYECSWGNHQRGQTRYYVSSGLGIWGAKFRIGTQSEYIVAAIQ